MIFNDIKNIDNRFNYFIIRTFDGNKIMKDPKTTKYQELNSNEKIIFK